MHQKVQTLDEFTIWQLRNFPASTGELATLLRDIALGAKRVNLEVNKAGLAENRGFAGRVNIQGEEVKKLDGFANDQFIHVLRQSISCAGVASEEEDDIVVFDDEKSNRSKYVVMMDPLDGSSNIDVNVSVGTIFGIYRRISLTGQPALPSDFLQPGNRQVAAGYVIYGSGTMLVYATRLGVNGFTLDQSIGEFVLTHPGIMCPDTGSIYSVNLTGFSKYHDGLQQYIRRCQEKNFENGGPYTQRYIGSMVADLHRNLLRGGIFMYPSTHDNSHGKLRLMYECNPMAYVIERAGGKATNGMSSILSVLPTELHQRSPIFIGSRSMMAELNNCMDKKTDD